MEFQKKNRFEGLLFFGAKKFSKTTPILIMHGTADWRVNPEDSLDLSKEFLKFKIPYRLIMFEGADHSISEFENTKNQMCIDWFNRFLKKGEKLPDLKPHEK